MVDYTNLQTLLDALDTQNSRVVRRCIRAGQSLNERINGAPLLAVALNNRNYPRIQSLLAFKKHLDINAVDEKGSNALWYIPTGPSSCLSSTLSHLIQHGIDVNNTYRGFTILDIWKDYLSHIEIRISFLLMVLSAGGNPQGQIHIMAVRNQVNRWLEGLEVAKIMFTEIFDNGTLEAEICRFVYNEEYLRMAVGR